MIRGYPEEGRAPPQGVLGTMASETAGEWNAQEDTVDSSEDPIALGELQTSGKTIEGEGESRLRMNQSYRRVTFTESAVKFAVSLFVNALASFHLTEILPGP